MSPPIPEEKTFYRHSLLSDITHLFQKLTKSSRSQRIVTPAPLPILRGCGNLPLERDDCRPQAPEKMIFEEKNDEKLAL
jgi:hypothetical protein